VSQACLVCSENDVYRKADYADDLCTEHHLRAQVAALAKERDGLKLSRDQERGYSKSLYFEAYEASNIANHALATGLQVAEALRAELALVRSELTRARMWSVRYP
jgi:hypothetical protein